MSTRRTLTAAAVTAVCAIAACSRDSTDDGVRAASFDFTDGPQGWIADTSDYSAATAPDDVVAEVVESAPDVDGDGWFHLAGSNRSDSLFLYLRREFAGEEIDVGQTYDLSYDLRFASSAPTGCAGIGGAPGESVWMKVGAVPDEPVPVTEDGDTRLSADKGNQSTGGSDAVVAGVIANGIECEEALDAGRPYAIVELSGALTPPVTTPGGSLWVFVGFDSGFEGRTSIYFDRIDIRLEPQSLDAP